MKGYIWNIMSQESIDRDITLIENAEKRSGNKRMA